MGDTKIAFGTLARALAQKFESFFHSEVIISKLSLIANIIKYHFLNQPRSIRQFFIHQIRQMAAHEKCFEIEDKALNRAVHSMLGCCGVVQGE